ncbi:MAG: acetyl-CoA carboxylase biotin carboxyl carrier protein subunit [Bacteroidia bacterium]
MLEANLQNDSYQIEIKGNEVTVNGQKNALDIISLQNGKYLHLIFKNHSYYFEIINIDKENKTVEIGYDGKSYTVGIKDRLDQLLHSMGLDLISKPKINEMRAPMPGLVLSISVKAEQEVKKGDPLLILEAMKMENIIKSPIDGSIKEIKIEEKAAVEKNQVLIVFN